MNNTLKRYLISSGVTFASAFLMTLGLQLQSGVSVQLTLPIVLGFVLVGLRAGVKAVAELLTKQIPASK